MGPDNSSPVQLYLMNEETGERIDLSATISELSITAKEDGEPMSCFGGCADCSHADRERKQGEKIRCKRWSCWVNPHGKTCEEYSFSFSFPIALDPIEQAERMKYFQRKQEEVRRQLNEIGRFA